MAPKKLTHHPPALFRSLQPSWPSVFHRRPVQPFPDFRLFRKFPGPGPVWPLPFRKMDGLRFRLNSRPGTKLGKRIINQKFRNEVTQVVLAFHNFVQTIKMSQLFIRDQCCHLRADDTPFATNNCIRGRLLIVCNTKQYFFKISSALIYGTLEFKHSDEL